MFGQHLKCSLTAPRRAGTSFGIFCFFSLSQLSEPGRLGTALSGPASRLASAMTFSGCDIDTSPTVDCCSFCICRTQSPEELGRVGKRSLGWTAKLSCGDTDFFFLMLTRRRGLGERGDKILRWRHSNCTHYDACRREIAWAFPETLRSASRKTEQPFQAQSVSHRADKTSLDCSTRVEAYTTGFSQTSILYPVHSVAARTAPNGVKERASFCLVFRSLNTTSSHRVFSMGYRKAKSTQGNTNFQKRIFLANNVGITTRGP